MKNDIVALLGGSHALLRKLGAQLRACSRQEEARLLFRQYALCLGAHLFTMNRVIYPGLKSVGWRNVRSDLLVGHAKLANLLADLLTLKSDSGFFVEGLADVIDATNDVLDRECDGLLPLLAKLEDALRIAFGLDAEPYLCPVSQGHPFDPGFASDWLEEARLLMGGLEVAPAVPDVGPAL